MLDPLSMTRNRANVRPDFMSACLKISKLIGNLDSRHTFENYFNLLNSISIKITLLSKSKGKNKVK